MFAPVNLCTPIIIPLLNNNDSLYCYPPTTREDSGDQAKPVELASRRDVDKIYQINDLVTDLLLPLSTTNQPTTEITFHPPQSPQLGPKSLVANNNNWGTKIGNYTTKSNNSCFKHIKSNIYGRTLFRGELLSIYPKWPINWRVITPIHQGSTTASHFTINVAANFVVYIKDNLHLVSSEPVQSPQLIWVASQEYIQGNDSLDHSSGEEHRNSNMLRVKWPGPIIILYSRHKYYTSAMSLNN